ncbi:hypothetical protein C2G38_2249459 [Gigaspora rosea]|uniref:Uncharacterized protein n=1 Tax=Gigaspora rosea TaxID=44941 RepID=A0A397UQC7_9GLOM|nr:hypothetical protein C2G38_2249459 [Gigaspora rosea]
MLRGDSKNSASDDYDIDLNETDFSDRDYEEKYEPSSSPISSDSDNVRKKRSKRKQPKSKVHEKDYCSSTNKNEDNPAPAIMIAGDDVPQFVPLSPLPPIPPLPSPVLPSPGSINSINNVITPKDLPTLVNPDQLSLLFTNPIIQTAEDDVESLSLPSPLLPQPGSINSINNVIPKDLPTLVNQVTNTIIQIPPPRPNVNNIQITPQKLMLFTESVIYLQNHIKIDVNGQGMIIKDNHTSGEISGIIRNWPITALTSPKEEFVKVIMTPLNSEASQKDCDFRQICEFILYDFYFMTKKGPLQRDIGERTYIVERIAPLFKSIQSVYNEYKFHWIEVELDCIREVKKIFPKFDLPIYQADGLGVRNSSKKEVVFIEILGGPENTDQKKLKEDSKKASERSCIRRKTVLKASTGIQKNRFDNLKLEKTECSRLLKLFKIVAKFYTSTNAFLIVLAKYGHGQYGPLDIDIYGLCPYCPYYFIGHKTLSPNKTHRLQLRNIPNIKQN